MSDLKHLRKLEEDYFRFINELFMNEGRVSDNCNLIWKSIDSKLLSILMDVYRSTNQKTMNNALQIVQRLVQFASALPDNVKMHQAFYFAGNLYDIHADVVSLDNMLEDFNETT